MGIEPHAYNIWKQCYLDVTLYIYIYCIYTVYLTKISCYLTGTVQWTEWETKTNDEEAFSCYHSEY